MNILSLDKLDEILGVNKVENNEKHKKIIKCSWSEFNTSDYGCIFESSVSLIRLEIPIFTIQLYSSPNGEIHKVPHKV